MQLYVNIFVVENAQTWCFSKMYDLHNIVYFAYQLW